METSRNYIPSNMSQVNFDKPSSDKERYTLLDGNVNFLKNEDLVSKGRLLIYGEAGSGKTMLANRLAYEWAKKNNAHSETLWDGDILVLVSLAEMNQDETIYDAIKNQCIPKDKNLLTSGSIQKVLENQRNYLLVLDGCDEYTERYSSSPQDSHVAQLIQFQIMQNALVVLLSRSERYFRVYTEQDIPVLRLELFESAQVEQYINLRYSDNESLVSNFQSDIKQNQYLEVLCEIPFFLSIITDIYERTPAIALPSITVTEYFKHFLNRKIQNGKNNNTDIGGDKRANILSKISKIAFNALCSDKHLISVKEMQKSCRGDELSLLEGSGVLQIIEPRFGRKGFYKFTHMLYQQYSAAHFLANVDNIRLLLKDIDIPAYQHLLIFTCGLNNGVLPLIVRYLLAQKDIFPYPISDCICYCLNEEKEVKSPQMIQCFTSLCQGKRGMEIRKTDSKQLLFAKSSLLDICKDQQVLYLITYKLKEFQ